MIISKHIGVIFVLLTTLLLAFSSCKKENPFVVYNDFLVNSKEKADSNFTSFNARLSETLKNRDFNNIDILINPMLDSINEQIKTVELLEVPENGAEFKTATIAYLESLSKAVYSYRSYGILSDENINVEQIDSINRVIRESESFLFQSSKKLLSTQSEFALATKIKLEINN